MKVPFQAQETDTPAGRQAGREEDFFLLGFLAPRGYSEERGLRQ